MAALRFPDAPPRIAKLPVSDRGFPIPFFAEEVNGVRDFRVVSAIRMAHAVRNDLCWVCGERLGTYKAFVIGPMCAINRTISDPPSHRDCAIFSAKNCPFLSSPLAKRRTAGLPENGQDAPGIAIKRNPGVASVWITRSYSTFRPQAGNAGMLFSLGEPSEVLWFCEGRTATREEVANSIQTGLPILMGEAQKQGTRAVVALNTAISRLKPLLPAPIYD